MKTTIMKKFGISTLTLLGFLFIYSQPLMAANISISPNSTTLSPGSTGSISILVDNDQSSVYSMQFVLTYDPNVITITGATTGANTSTCNTNPAATTPTGGCNVLFNTNTPGIVNVGLYSSSALSQDQPSQPDPLQDFVINYTIKNTAASGVSNLTLSQAMFDEPNTANYTLAVNPNLVQPTVTSGSITVGSGSPTTAWGEVLTDDTSVTPADASAVFNEALHIPVANFVAKNALVDGVSTTPTIYDASLILKYYLHQISSFPAQG